MSLIKSKVFWRLLKKVAWELIPTNPYSPTHVQCTHTVASDMRQRQFTFVTFVTTIILYDNRGVTTCTTCLTLLRDECQLWALNPRLSDLTRPSNQEK